MGRSVNIGARPMEPAARPLPPESSPRDRLMRSEPVAAVALLSVACACAFVLLVVPRPSVPLQLPNLTLPEQAVRRVIEADARAAQTAPTSERARALEALLLEQGRAESTGLEDAAVHQQRRYALERGLRELAREVGETAALGLRARSVQQLEAALALELTTQRAEAVLGALPNVLAREQATRDGSVVAPHFVIRTLFKARWNILHGLPPAHAFEVIEERAFYGWQALHAERVVLARRLKALDAYASAGGEHAEEARGVLLFAKDEAAAAARAFEQAHRELPSLRLRNYLRTAQTAADRRESSAK